MAAVPPILPVGENLAVAVGGGAELAAAAAGGLEEHAALLQRNATVLLRQPGDPIADYLIWLSDVLRTTRLETQTVIIPRILPPRGTWRGQLGQLSNIYFRRAVQRWVTESGPQVEETRTRWMATAAPVIRALSRAPTDWPERGVQIVHELIGSFQLFVSHTRDTFIWLFVVVIETAREDDVDINWRIVFENTAPAEFDTEQTLNTLEGLLSLPVLPSLPAVIVDPAITLAPVEVLIEQAKELLSRLPGSADEYLEWWQHVTRFVQLETQDVVLPQLLPLPGQWQPGTIASSGRGVPWQFVEHAYFSNAFKRWVENSDAWIDTARPVVKALLRAPALRPDDIDSQTAMIANMIRSFKTATNDYEETTLGDEYALLYDVAVKLAHAEGRSVNWERVVIGTLPPSLTQPWANGEDTFPQLDAVLDPLLLTPEQLADKARLKKRRLQLASNLAVAPDIPPPEEAQLLLIALTETPTYKPTPETWEQLSDAYKQLIRDVFRSAEIETQNDIPQYLPSPAALGTSEDVALLLSSAQVTPLYASMIIALIFDEGRASQTIEGNVAAVIQHGDHLLNYMIMEAVHSGPHAFLESTLTASVRGLARNMMGIFVAVWWDPNHTFKGKPITFAVFDPIILWLLVRSNQLAIELDLPPPDPIEIRDILLEYHLPPERTTVIYPTFLPLTALFLQPRITAAEAAQRALETARAVTGLRQRLTARRRLSSAVPFFFEPQPGALVAFASAHPLEAKEELKGLEPPLFVAPPTRRSSTRLPTLPADLPPSAIRAFLAQQQEAERASRRIITPASSSTEIRSWLAQQEAQEAAFAATLPLIPLATRARWQQGRRTSLAAVLAAEPPRPDETTEQEEQRIYQAKKAAGVHIMNCEKFAHETCSESHNQGGVHWCAVPEQFRWGPISGKKCYDVREILREFTRQVTDIPSVPYKARPLTYPDRVPVRPNHLQTLLTIAQENKLPIPTEIHLYLAGRELQRAPPAYMASDPSIARRLKERQAYAAVPLFLEAQEEAISRELQGSIYSGASAAQVETESEEEEEEEE